MSEQREVPHLYGLAGEYETPEALTAAARRVVHEGYRHVEAYSPFAVEGVLEVLRHRTWPVALMTLIAGIIGGLTGFGMCWYANVINYPIEIGGRPHNSWPAWIPITFELTVLFAALTGAIGMVALNGLPRLHHPIFEIPGFERASRDRFFLCIEARDEQFDAGRARVVLHETGAMRVEEVWE